MQGRAILLPRPHRPSHEGRSCFPSSPPPPSIHHPLCPTQTHPNSPYQVICHCLTCQKLTASAFSTNLFIPKPSLTVLSGEDVLRTYTHPHETGFPITVHFCGTCATTLWKHGGNEKFDHYWVVQAGTLDAEGKGGLDVIRPTEEYWTSLRASWLGNLEGMRQFREFA